MEGLVNISRKVRGNGRWLEPEVKASALGIKTSRLSGPDSQD